MKNFYIAVSVQQDKNERIFAQRETNETEPGFFAYIIPCNEATNLKTILNNVGGLLHANIYNTKKRAAETVNAWNEAYKRNGTHLYY